MMHDTWLISPLRTKLIGLSVLVLGAGIFGIDAKPASARCEVAPATGGPSRNCGGGNVRRSTGNDAAAQALQLGVGLLQQNLQNQSNDDDMEEWKRSQGRKLQAHRDKVAREKANAAAQAAALEQQSSGAEIANPWGKKVKATAKEGDQTTTAIPGDGAAPLVDGSKCVKLTQRSKGKVDWDYLDIKNDCAFPIQLLVCTYDVGDNAKCSNPNAWGTTDQANPGSNIFTISTSRGHPYKVRFYTCNMSGIKDHAKLCLNPLRKGG